MRETEPDALRVARPWLVASAATADAKAALSCILASVEVRAKLFASGCDLVIGQDGSRHRAVC